MKWFALGLLVALFALVAAAPRGQIRVRTSSTTSVRVHGNVNIKWNGNCHNCNIRADKNSAQVTSTRTGQWTRRF